MAVCAIPTCPIIPIGSQKYCMPHKDARTAKELRIAKDPTTLRGGESCITCKRKFIETDFVLVKTVATLRRRKKSFGWQHVQCEPPTARLSKKKIRESEKPLFADADADVAHT